MQFFFPSFIRKQDLNRQITNFSFCPAGTRERKSRVRFYTRLFYISTLPYRSCYFLYLEFWYWFLDRKRWNEIIFRFLRFFVMIITDVCSFTWAMDKLKEWTKKTFLIIDWLVISLLSSRKLNHITQLKYRKCSPYSD